MSNIKASGQSKVKISSSFTKKDFLFALKKVSQRIEKPNPPQNRQKHRLLVFAMVKSKPILIDITL